MHGGIPDIKDFSFDRIRRLERPITKNVPNESANSDERLITDLMWADPAWPQDSRDQGPVMLYGVNEQRQTSHVFGPDALAQFMDAHGLDLIARAHECVDDGFKFFSGPGHPMGCITIFSAPNYWCVPFPRDGAQQTPMLRKDVCCDSDSRLLLVLCGSIFFALCVAATEAMLQPL